MTVVIANDAVQVFLSSIKTEAEIRNPAGGILGYFKPAPPDEDLLYEQAKALFDPEEVERRAASKERGYTTEEVLSHLRSTGNPG